MVLVRTQVHAQVHSKAIAALSRLAVAAVTGVALSIGGMGTAAVAAAPPSIASFGCEGGSGMYFCFVSWTGGVAPVSVRWFKDGNPVSAFDDRTFLLQHCQIGTSAVLMAVVSDATGGSDERARRVNCTLL